MVEFHLWVFTVAIARPTHYIKGPDIANISERTRKRTLLLDETVKATARDWLASQPTGDVTPRRFQDALNNQILPALNIELKKPLCERTARRWLIKLGWRMTRIRKGVYLDGHEREDVVKYRNEEFLPRMKQYEARMTRYVLDGNTLKAIEPTLEPGQKKIIALFQDESSFHANEFKSSTWFALLSKLKMG